MKLGRINYVISAWSGKRRDGGNGLDCLRKQIDQLHLLKHSLDRITVIVADNPSEPDNFESYISRLGGTHLPVIVLHRENVGLSYGAWSCTYDLYRTTFDYYIFMEDDYYFVEDHFDKTLVEMLGEHGYLCGFVSDNGKVRWPGNSIGIASSKVLERIREKFGCLPYDLDAADGKYTEESGQVAWGRSFQECGYDLADIASRRYGCLHWYWQHRECRLVLGQPPNNGRFLYVPYQARLNHSFLLHKDKYKGKEGILFATGPTLNQYDFLEDDGNRIRVGVNSAVSLQIQIDYYFCGHMDERSSKYLNYIQAYGGYKFGYTRVDGKADERWLSDRQALDLGVIPYELTTDINFQVDIANHPLVDHTINFSALQFMVYTGIKRIYLVGCDVTATISHKDSRIDTNRSVDMMMTVWKAFKEFSERMGVEIVSINPVGLKGMFKERVCASS